MSESRKHVSHVQYTIPIPQYEATIWTLSLRRSLVEFEDFVIAHFKNQILRFLTEVVDLLGFLVVIEQHVPVWVTFELLN